MMGKIMKNRIFSVDDNPKASKASEYGWMNAIHYMAPASLSGYNMCAMSTPDCETICIGWHTGQASMVAHESDMNNVRLSRIQKARRYMESREEYMRDVCRSIELLQAVARRAGKKLCIRLNGSTDVPFERVPVTHHGTRYANIMLAFPSVQFDDYTKMHNRFDRELPPNYYLVYSRAEGRSDIALRLLSRGVSVAIVSRRHKPKRGELLRQWCGFQAVDGDAHDLIHLWPRGSVIALSPKGPKAKRLAHAADDGEGFVL